MMSLEFFRVRMRDLNNCFGRSMSSKREELVYSIVKELPEDWFEGVVKKFCLELRSLPLPADFTEQVNLYKKSKAPSFSQSVPRQNDEKRLLDPSEVSSLISLALGSKGSPKDREDYLKTAFTVLDKRACKKCKDGIVMALKKPGLERYCFKCTCSLGNKRQENWPVWSMYLTDFVDENEHWLKN